MVIWKTKVNARALCLKLLAFSSIWKSSKAQQNHNVFYNTAPVYRPYEENSYWRNSKPHSLRLPFNGAYYATSPPHMHTHTKLHSGSPNGFLASPYQTGTFYGPQYAFVATTPPTTLLRNINQQLPPQQLLSIQRQRQTQLDQERHYAPKIVQEQRNKGNFYPETMINATSRVAQRKHEQGYQLPFLRSPGNTGNTGYVAFDHKVLHVTTERIPLDGQDNRKRRSFPFGESNVHPKSRSTKTKKYRELSNNAETHDDEKLLTEPSNEGHRKEAAQKTQFFHDIFLHYADPQSIAYGHVERQPLQFAKRFESLNKGNRYRGEVTWTDMKTGGYGTHHWDLAQGSL